MNNFEQMFRKELPAEWAIFYWDPYVSYHDSTEMIGTLSPNILPSIKDMWQTRLNSFLVFIQLVNEIFECLTLFEAKLLECFIAHWAIYLRNEPKY